MIRQFPIDEHASPKRRRPRRFRLRYLLLPLLLIGISFISLPDGKGGSEVIPAAQSTLSRGDLGRIDRETIERCNLTIRPDMQQFIAGTAERYKMYYGTIVVMDARTGDILAMYGRGTQGEDCTLCLEANHAASVFKIVTAVAAMEQGGYTGNSVFTYTGSAHTLYRHQLVNRNDRWTADVTLADAFAHSNNVVFAKIGTIYLGETPILLTAMKMGFWQSPLREIECSPSTMFFPENDYNLAELTSGFNRQTKITPVHAAQMVSAAVNNGQMVTPRIIRGGHVEKVSVMSENTAHHLASMMERTIRCGTVSKEFRNCRSDRVLRDITIGAKSGSIDGDEPMGRRNWFVGFARNDAGDAIAIGCLLVLDARYWIQADTLSRLIIRHYFSSQSASVAQNN